MHDPKTLKSISGNIKFIIFLSFYQVGTYKQYFKWEHGVFIAFISKNLDDILEIWKFSNFVRDETVGTF